MTLLTSYSGYIITQLCRFLHLVVHTKEAIVKKSNEYFSSSPGKKLSFNEKNLLSTSH